MLLTIFTFSVAAFIAVVGSFVLLRNKKSRSNVAFTVFTCTVSLWIVVNYLGANYKGYSWAGIATQTDLFIGPLLAASLFMFCRTLASSSGFESKKIFSYIICSLALGTSFLSLTPSIAEISFIEGNTSIQYGELYFVYSFILALITLISYAILIITYRKSTGLVRSQISTMLFGTGVAVIFVVVPNLVVPLITESAYINLVTGNLAYLGLAFFVGMTSYAIIKHRLFDVRLVVARSLGYLLSVGALAFIYGILAFTVIDTFIFSQSTNETLKQFIYTLLALVLAFTFQPLKKFFDKWTNRLFYRDAYDSQELLDKLNKVLVSTLELEKLLKNSAKIINESIRTEFIVFNIKENEKASSRIIGLLATELNNTDLNDIALLANSSKAKSIIADELEDEKSHLRNVMIKNQTAVLVKLRESSGSKLNSLGYMILGNKKSGSPFSGQDIKVLEIIADELVIAIQNALRFEEIQQFNITLQQKVDDATKKLRAANKRLIELDQTKDDFISMASHQLRTPLTSIKGYVSMVIEGDAGKVSKKQADLLSQSFNSAQRMVYLIADLLNVSRLRTGKFIIEPKETNLAEVIEGEMAQLTETAKGRNLELKYNKPDKFPVLMLDETKIRQVIMNFIDNAIYYTPTEGHINVNLEDKGENIEFTVVDDGIGVPKTVQHNLFNKFYRADNAKKARPDGTGLGLFMAKKVVVAQGGSIIFKSAEGKGSTFGFSFTKKQLLPENFKGIEADKAVAEKK